MDLATAPAAWEKFPLPAVSDLKGCVLMDDTNSADLSDMSLSLHCVLDWPTQRNLRTNIPKRHFSISETDRSHDTFNG